MAWQGHGPEFEPQYEQKKKNFQVDSLKFRTETLNKYFKSQDCLFYIYFPYKTVRNHPRNDI
jgi:hypothetical protein